jgi:hypothetical protein
LRYEGLALTIPLFDCGVFKKRIYWCAVVWAFVAVDGIPEPSRFAEAISTACQAFLVV